MQRKLLALIMLVMLLLTSACAKTAKSTDESTGESQDVAITTVQAKEQNKSTELSGTLQPSEETMVSFEIPGKIIALEKKEGDSVSDKEILAVLDTEGYEIGVEQADANVEQAGAALSEVRKGAREQELLQAKAVVDKAQAGYQNALDNFNRIKVLYEQGAVAQSVYESTKTGLTVAEKDLTLAKQSYSLAVEGASPETKDRTAAAYKLAQTAKQQASLTLSKTKLTAPFTGTIVNKLVSEGQLVSAGIPVYRIGNVDSLKIILPVPDYEIKDWSIGDKVTLTLYDEDRVGKVTNIAPAASMGTGAIGVEIQVSNPKHDWYVGQIVIAKRQIKGEKLIYVPVEAVVSRGEKKPYVFKAENNKAVKTEVEIGELANNSYEVISGLKEGDKIVLKGADRLYDGQLIETVRGN